MYNQLRAVAALTLLLAPPARATLLQAVRPGAICTSPEALAKLTLPDGSSRAAATNRSPSPAAEAIARAGQCFDFSRGKIVILVTARHNTSIVRADPSGDGVLVDAVIPNIDFAPHVPRHDPALDLVRAMCPSRLEAFDVLGVPAYDFIQTLPRATRDQMGKEADDRCGGAPGCTDAAIEDEIRNRHLDRQRVAYACSHQ